MIQDPADPSKLTIELISVPSNDFLMVAVDGLLGCRTSSLSDKFAEVPESEQDPVLAAKVMADFEKAVKLDELKETLDKAKKSRQRSVDLFALLQESLKKALPEIEEMNKNILQIEKEIKEAEAN